jgi:hypothetical protein
MRQIQWVHVLNRRPSITPAPHGVAYHRRAMAFAPFGGPVVTLVVDTILPERNG